MFDWLKPIDESMVYKRYWLPALHALGLPHSRWHDMRHTFATHSLQREHYRDVSRWLGHSKVSTTLDIYAANIPSEDTVKASPTVRPVPAAVNADLPKVAQLQRKKRT
jgi:integrase